MFQFVDYFGHPVELTFDAAVYSTREAKHVLIFPFFHGKLLFTIHTERGIELPGGKIEPGETSMAAAVREMYEETGHALCAIEKIGQYVINSTMVKDIYIARVERFVEQMKGGNVGGVISFEDIPDNVRADTRFSRILADDVYPLTLKHIANHPFRSEN